MFPRKIVVLAVGAFAAMLATGWVSYRTTRVVASAVRWVDHTRSVLLSAAECRSLLLRVESATRGYAITGDSGFIADFDHAGAALRRETLHLQTLTADNPAQLTAMTGLDALVERRLALLRTLATQRRGGAPASAIESTILSGESVTDSIARMLDQIRAEEVHLLSRRAADSERAQVIARIAPWVMCLIAALLSALLVSQVARAMRSENEARTRAEEAAIRERVARQRAEESDRLKDEFLVTVSHELRTPLTAIVGWAGLLANSELRGDALETGLRNIHHAARAQAQLVEDLLDVSRTITGKMRLSLEPVDLRTIIEQAVDSVSPSADARNIRIQLIGDTRVDGVLGDPERLQQVVWNLLSNAVKFTPKDGNIQVLLRRVNSHAEISVSDDGIGIAPDFLPMVFDRFRQQESGPTRRAGGLGLGLAIVKQLVELHGGAVRVRSDGEGKGATFTVELPVSSLAAQEGAGHAVPEWRSATADPGRELQPVDSVATSVVQRRRMVVIEDDPRTLTMLGTVLSRAGARVVTAATAAEGLALLAAERTDAIVCDIGLPEEDGLAFLRRLRAMAVPYANVPAIALTAFARPEDRLQALAAGFNAYLSKPVSPEELLLALASTLRTGQDQRPH